MSKSKVELGKQLAAHELRLVLVQRDIGRLIRLVSLNRQFIQEVMNYDNTNFPAQVVGSHGRIDSKGDSSGIVNNVALIFPIPTLDALEANVIRTQLVPGGV